MSTPRLIQDAQRVSESDLYVLYTLSDRQKLAVEHALQARESLLLDALRAFCGDHEATGMECAGLNAAYLHAKALIADIDAGIARGVK